MKVGNFNPALSFLLVVMLSASSFAANLFSEMSLGMGRSSYKEEFQGHRNSNGSYVKGEYAHFSGVGPSAELKLGGSTEYFAIFASTGFVLSFGSHDLVHTELNFNRCPGSWDRCYDYMETNDVENSSATRFYAGFGGIYYPFATSSDMPKGLYIGTTVTIMGMISETESYIASNGEVYGGEEINRDGFGLEFEVGHLWSVNSVWNVGVAMVLTRDFPFDRGDDAKYSFNTLWFGVTLVKK